MYDMQKPPLDELAHYGVKGMKWGRTKVSGSSTQIKDARIRDEKAKTQFEKAHKKASKIADPAARNRALKDADKINIARLKNPDRVLAARMTRGEKAMSLIASTLLTGSPVIGGAAIGAASVNSRRIEGRQERNGYSPNKRGKQLADSKFGKASAKNVDRYNKRKFGTA